MNADLSRQLDEMGPEYHDLVVRMRSAFEPERRNHHTAWLVAASLPLVVGLSVLLTINHQPLLGLLATKNADNSKLCGLCDLCGEKQTINRFPREYMLASLRSDEAVREMIRTQRSDGSWKNVFLTRQNAAALRESSLPEAQISYKRAKRVLRMSGL